MLSINLANTCPPFKYGAMMCLLLEPEVLASGSNEFEPAVTATKNAPKLRFSFDMILIPRN